MAWLKKVPAGAAQTSKLDALQQQVEKSATAADSAISVFNQFAQQMQRNPLAAFQSIQSASSWPEDALRIRRQADQIDYRERLRVHSFDLLGRLLQQESSKSDETGALALRAKECAEALLGLLGEGKPQE